jgi:hypothetical protein
MKNIIAKIKEYSLMPFKILQTLKEFAIENSNLLTIIFFVISIVTESVGMVIFTFAFLIVTKVIYAKRHYNMFLSIEVLPSLLILISCYAFLFQIWYAYVLENTNKYHQKILETKYYPKSNYQLTNDNQLILKDENGKVTVEKLNINEISELLIATFNTDEKSTLVTEEREVRFFNNLIPVRYTKFRFTK